MSPATRRAPTSRRPVHTTSPRPAGIPEDARTVYLVIAPAGPTAGRWGKAFTLDQAKQNAGNPKVWVAYQSTDPWIVVDDMGYIVYTPATPNDQRTIDTPPTYWESERCAPPKG